VSNTRDSTFFISGLTFGWDTFGGIVVVFDEAGICFTTVYILQLCLQSGNYLIYIWAAKLLWNIAFLRRCFLNPII